MTKTFEKKTNPKSTVNSTGKPTGANPQIRRKHIRFKPDPGSMAFILTDPKGKKLESPLPCLILQESYAGAGLVTLKNTPDKNTDLHKAPPKKGMRFQIKVGHLEATLCEVKWTQSLNPDVLAFGVEYCD